jgi:signal transduction histidine kinase
MKCSEIRTVFEGVGSLFAANGHVPPRGLLELIELLDSTSYTTISQLAKTITRLKIDSDYQSTAVSDLLTVARSTADLLQNVGKPAVIKDINLLVSSLDRHASCSAQELVDTLKTEKLKSEKSAPVATRLDVVQAHFRSLENALGDDRGFNSAFSALEIDPNARTPELVALAKQFSFANVKSRAAALKKIFARHQALMTSRAKSAATGGRIAG